MSECSRLCIYVTQLRLSAFNMEMRSMYVAALQHADETQPTLLPNPRFSISITMLMLAVLPSLSAGPFALSQLQNDTQEC